MPKLKAHLFICTKCSEEAIELRKNLKQYVVEKYGKDSARVTASSCLGECDRGIASVLYPKGEWILNLSLKDEEKLKTIIDSEMNS